MYFWKNGKTENRHLSNAHTRYRHLRPTFPPAAHTAFTHGMIMYVCVELSNTFKPPTTLAFFPLAP